jgi:hypothetical protein
MSDLENLMINLKVLGEVRSGDKIKTKGIYFEIDNDFPQCIMRHLRNEGRVSTRSNISALANGLLRAKEYLLEGKDTKQRIRLLEDIKKANIGIENLIRDTYSSDVVTQSHLRQSVEKFEELIKFIGYTEDEIDIDSKPLDVYEMSEELNKPEIQCISRTIPNFNQEYTLTSNIGCDHNQSPCYNCYNEMNISDLIP